MSLQKCFHYDSMYYHHSFHALLMIHTYIIVRTPNLGAFKMVGGILSFRRPIPQKMAAGWVWPCTHGVVPFWNVVFAGWYIAAASIGLVTKRQRLPLSFTQKYPTYGPELGHCKVKQAYLKKIIFVTYGSNLNFKLWTHGKTLFKHITNGLAWMWH